MLLLIAIILLALWLTGNLFWAAGTSLVHVLVVVALVCVIVHFWPRIRGGGSV